MLYVQCFPNILHFTQDASFQSSILSNIAADINHRPSDNLKNSKAYISHLKRTLQKIINMQIEFEGYLDFSAEEISVKNQLALLGRFDENRISYNN